LQYRFVDLLDVQAVNDIIKTYTSPIKIYTIRENIYITKRRSKNEKEASPATKKTRNHHFYYIFKNNSLTRLAFFDIF